MKHRTFTWLTLGLLLVTTVHAEVLQAEGVEAAGQVDGLALRLLELHRPDAAAAWESTDLELKASNVTLEAWYEDSGGTPIPFNPKTERQIIYEGQVDAFQGHARARHYQFLYADAAEIASMTFIDLQPHDKAVRPFPTFVNRTGAEEEVPLEETILAAVPDQAEIAVAAPFTLVLWNWNITFDGVSGPEAAWSGTRPHGAGTSMFAPFGFDAQLLVMRVHNGTLTMPVPAQDLRALHILVDNASVVGSITTSRSWLPSAPGEAEERIYVGNHSLAARMVNDTVLQVTVEPKDNAAPAPNPARPTPQGQSPLPTPESAKLEWLSGIAALVLTAGATYAVLRTWQWHVLVTAFRSAAYGRVAAEAGRFHSTIGVRGRAQAMTMVSALKLGQHKFVLDNLARMNALEAPVAMLLRNHALQGLGLSPASSESLPSRDWPDEIRALDSSPAYS